MKKTASDPSSGQNRNARIIFWLVVVLLVFSSLGYRGLWGSEDRWAEVTREMFLNKDFFHPTINGAPYFDKPLLSYWLIALVTRLTGTLNELTVRIPSAISGIIALWATISLGRRLNSERVGICAGWIMLTSYGVLFWTRTASAEMENLAAIILALYWYWTHREKPGFISFLIFYLICFAGAHTKGLTSVVIPTLAILPDLVREQRWRKLLSVSHFMALFLGIVVYLVPFFYAGLTNNGYQESGLTLVFHENILRYFKPFDHKDPVYIYFYYVPIFLLPWAPLFFSALRESFSSFKKMPRSSQWLIEAMAVIFLFFTASGSRRSYYILPILPLCSLFIANFLDSQAKLSRKPLGFHFQTGLLVLVAMVEILSPITLLLVTKHTGFIPPHGLTPALVTTGLLALSPWAIARLQPDLLATFLGVNQRIAPGLLSAIIILGGFFCWQQPTLDQYRREKPYAEHLKTLLVEMSPQQIAFYRARSTTTLFYLNLPGPVQILNDQKSALNFLSSEKKDKILITQRKYLKDALFSMTPELREKPTLSEKTYPWQKHNRSQYLAWKLTETN